jgi:hypothetical protein
VTGGILGFGDSQWDVSYWKLDYNGTHLGTCDNGYVDERFEGEREIRTPVIKDSAFEEPLDESVKALAEQGEKFYNLLSKKCQYYKGPTFNFPHHQVSSKSFGSRGILI